MLESWPRRRLLKILRDADRPLDARTLSERTGQHVTTVRFHLEVLTKNSAVRPVQLAPQGRGRPSTGYSVVQRSAGYQELARVLADQLGVDRTHRLDAAVTAGRAWAAKIDDSVQSVDTLDDAKRAVTTAQSQLGFAPVPERTNADAENDGTPVSIRLTACPLRALARTNPDVVCGVHLGLLREMLDRAGARGEINASLHPFVEPDVCLARLARA
ncbi:helix-turn-helix transcriptional regulator [Antrihabitans cavernicola]|uniref:helix-turn-helix transcriptional regulator n=1 Tax=Antrihabitans cavernicola TaxID=2495913 RepID=UPI001658D4AC|nr:transcriptional regulator [Spelaeibacter cavernicola]